MISGILKRKHEEGPSSHLSTPASDDEVSCSDSGNSSDSLNHPVPSGLLNSSLQQKSKRFRGRNVHFENVTVYYFGRRQGFTSVPTQGGSTLGMSPRHSCVKNFTLREFAMEQKRSHRNMLRHHLKEEKLNAIRLKLTKNGTESSVEADTLTLDDISVDELDVDNTEVDDYFFLQPLTTRRRRALLRASGVRRIDVEEKHELRALRLSREECGCRCRGMCDPETCACSLAGIKCQVNGSVVDRMSFPCGCTKEGCSNTTGRLEFNPVRVRTHFLHTIMKLELEKSREEQPHHRQQPLPPEHQQQQLVTNGNGFHSDPSSLVQTQQQPNLQFPLMMHLQNDTTDPHLDDEEEEDEDEDDEEEEEEDEAYEDEEDGSSVCSGLSDCSTHSLDTNDPEEGEDSEEEEDEEDDDGEEEEEDDWDCPLQSTNAPPYPVPLPSILTYSNNALTSPPFSYNRDSENHPTLPTVDTALNSDQGVPCRLPPHPLPNSPNLSHAQLREGEAASSGEHSALLQNNPDWCDSQTENVAKEQTGEEEGETLEETNQNAT
ncbi:cysteine/serine-rich nuclear protein 3-like [Boleophthalmus pectinirostris]|uniref:cysteine/serine-rich nuclear protein 3-like n=1 Tax=Boleophthalmus pectinirostris TaxID=150288 RepID=UPI00242A9468|nr:cysteine/serine-rich nuclear protein 3-like [Boleophthalmus pectinirostris]